MKRKSLNHLRQCLVGTLVLLSCGAAHAVDDFGKVIGGKNEDPKLIVFVHGATPRPNDPANLMVPEPDSATLDFARFYWGYGFVRRLLGARKQQGLKNLSGDNLKDSNWDAYNPPNRDNKVTFKHGCSENTLGDHFIVPGNYTGDATPPLAGLLTYRDGSRLLMTQTKTLIDQVYERDADQFGTVQRYWPYLN